VPTETPPNPLWEKSEKKKKIPGISCVVVCRMKPFLYDILTNKKDSLHEEQYNSVRLLQKWFDDIVEGRPEHLKRLKCIPSVQNTNDLEIGSLMKGLWSTYNAKPFMTGPTCNFFHWGPDYMEVNYNVNGSNYVARKASPQLLDLFPTMVANVALVVQGDADKNSELPEKVLCGWTICRVDIKSGKTLEQRAARQARKLSSAKDSTEEGKQS